MKTRSATQRRARVSAALLGCTVLVAATIIPVLASSRSVVSSGSNGQAQAQRLLPLQVERAGAHADELTEPDALIDAEDGGAGAPDATDTPDATDAPEATDTPDTAEPPEATDAPEVTDGPEATEKPKATHTKHPTKTADNQGDNKDSQGDNNDDQGESDQTSGSGSHDSGDSGSGDSGDSGSGDSGGD